MANKVKDAVDKSCKEIVYLTPDYILDCVRAYFGGPIPLDPATEPSNPTKALRFYTARDNSLIRSWDSNLFINPPYGGVIKLFAKKIYLASLKGHQIIALLPCGARFSTAYWQRYILSERLTNMCYIDHRVKFLRGDLSVADANPFDSILYAFNGDQDSINECFASLGVCMSVKAHKKVG